jgi:hypothetical protein
VTIFPDFNTIGLTNRQKISNIYGCKDHVYFRGLAVLNPYLTVDLSVKIELVVVGNKIFW